jgi:hypothetical protein
VIVIVAPAIAPPLELVTVPLICPEVANWKLRVDGTPGLMVTLLVDFPHPVLVAVTA